MRFRMDETVLRYWEYSLSAGILMLATQSTIVGYSAPVWSLQSVFVGLFTCNLLGLPLHLCVVLKAIAMESGWKMQKIHMLGWTCGMLLMASWFTFFGAWYVSLQLLHAIPCVRFSLLLTCPSRVSYFSYLPYFLGPEFPINVWETIPGVAWLTLLLIIFYTSFGALATWVYLPWILKNQADENATQKLRMKCQWLSNGFDILSITVKLLTVGIIAGGNEFGARAPCPL